MKNRKTPHTKFHIMIKHMIKRALLLLLVVGFATVVQAADEPVGSETETPSLSLITADAEEGFQLAITLARKGVTETQPDREILFQEREVYSRDADALIAASQVIAIHFQTIAAANDYWREE